MNQFVIFKIWIRTGFLQPVNKYSNYILTRLISISEVCEIMPLCSRLKSSKLCSTPRYTDTQRELSFKNLELLSLGRYFGLKFFEAFGVFSAGLSAPILVLWVPCPCFLLFNHYFYKKNMPLYPTPKYLFGSGIWIGVAKNLRFSLRVSIVREVHSKNSHAWQIKPK